jgi:Domain of unknown function (DUF4375)
MTLPPLPDEFMNATGVALYDVANEYLAVVFEHRHGDNEDEAIRALPQPLADLWILGWLDFENIQAGLPTYFTNAHGRQATLAIEVLRRCGADDIAACLEEALAIAIKHQDEWMERERELDRAGEYAVVQPFKGLKWLDEVEPAAARFDELWLKRKPSWQELITRSLERFRDEMAKKRTSADEEASRAYWEAAKAREEPPKAHEESAKVRKELPPEAEALIALLEQKKAEADRLRGGRGE